MLAYEGANVPGLRHSVCDHCHEYITTPEQSRQNKIVLEAEIHPPGDSVVTQKGKAQGRSA